MFKSNVFAIALGAFVLGVHGVPAQPISLDRQKVLVSVFAASRCMEGCREVNTDAPPSAVRVALEPVSSSEAAWLQQAFVTWATQVPYLYFGALPMIAFETSSSENLPSLQVRKADIDAGILCVGPDTVGASGPTFVVRYGQQFYKNDGKFKLAVTWCAVQFAKWLLHVESEGEFMTPQWPLSQDETRLYFKALSAFTKASGRTVHDFSAEVAAAR